MVRSLPIRVPPHPGEGLDSYLEALAARHHAAWGDVLDAVGLDARIVRWARGVLVADGVAGGPGSRPADQLRGRLRHSAVNDAGGPDQLRRRITLHRSADGAGVFLAAAVAVLPGMPGRNGMSNCQYLWIKIFYAASSVVVSWSGRSTSLPFSNRAPARTSATRWGALIARQRDWAASISL